MTEIKALLMSWVIALFPGMDPNLPQTYAGYVEADYLYVAPTATREILRLEVREGEEVEAGQFLFEQEDSLEAAALRAAEARRDAAAAELENLETGSRTAEIEVIRASLEQAKAEQTLALSNLARSQQLFEREIVTQAKVDTDRAALESANALVAELEARLEVAELPARDAQIVAARAQLNAAEADLDSARSALDDLKVVAPRGGLVEKIFYDAGEVAPAGSPFCRFCRRAKCVSCSISPNPNGWGFRWEWSLQSTVTAALTG